MARRLLLGLDWGGGGVRALLVDAESGECWVRRRPLAPLEAPGSAGFGWTLDLEGGLRALGAALGEALAAAGAEADQVLGVAATSIRFAHVVLGPGAAILDAASNRDARAADLAGALRLTRSRRGASVTDRE